MRELPLNALTHKNYGLHQIEDDEERGQQRTLRSTSFPVGAS
jgi:hypothetical protein